MYLKEMGSVVLSREEDSNAKELNGREMMVEVCEIQLLSRHF